MIRNELLGEVNNGLLTLVTVNVKLVPELIIWDNVTFIKLADITEHVDDIPLFNVHVESDTFSWVYDGKVIFINDPEMSLFTVTNQSSYEVTLPIVVTWAFTPLCVIVEGVLVNCMVV